MQSFVQRKSIIHWQSCLLVFIKKSSLLIGYVSLNCYKYAVAVCLCCPAVVKLFISTGVMKSTQLEKNQLNWRNQFNFCLIISCYVNWRIKLRPGPPFRCTVSIHAGGSIRRRVSSLFSLVKQVLVRQSCIYFYAEDQRILNELLSLVAVQMFIAGGNVCEGGRV